MAYPKKMGEGRLVQVVVAGLLLLVSDARADRAPPSMLGSWEVEHVAVDRNDQPHWNLRPDDPLLMWRELLVGAEEVRFNGDQKPNCKSVKWKAHAVKWKDVMADLLRSPDTRPSPADYGLKFAVKDRVTVVSVCATLGPGDARVLEIPYLIQNGQDGLLMLLNNQTLLVFGRRKSDARPVPSFPCAKAMLPAEKAICGSFSLAGWDRSVALGWQHRKTFGLTSEDVEKQKAYLNERNSCGADGACLETRMRDRTSDLEHP